MKNIFLFLVVFALVSACSEEPVIVEASDTNVSEDTSSEQTGSTFRITAFIDGRSQLILQGNTAQWHHMDFAAPGRHTFGSNNSGQANLPTTINGVDWYPIWPDVGGLENRDCNCLSDIYDGIDPPFPVEPFVVTRFKILQGRGNINIVQQPTGANQFTLIVEIDDHQSGDDKYILNVTYR